jgi:F-type H+-transporting ATPase subunit a
MIKKNRRNTFSLIFIIVLVVGMALLSFQLRKTQGFVPTPVAEEISPKVMFTVGPVQVTSTVVNTWVMIALLGIASFFGGRSLKIRPVMLQNALEWLIEAIQGIIKGNIETDNTNLFFPIVATFAIFIGTANLLGLIPGLSSPTPDINTPLAMALIVFVSVPFFGIKTRGLWKYLKHYVQPIFLMLPIEIASEIARTFSLSFRLFGNIMGEEIIIAILFLISPFILPVPMMLFSIFTGILQAYIFTLLSCVYIGGAVKAHATN